MKGPNLAELEAFAAVADASSFRKAATGRGVSASALSQNIRNLEERLGVRLLNRTTRSVAPTEAGHELLRRLRPAFAEVAEAVEAVNSFRQKPAGTVRINAPAPAIEFFLAPLAKDFLNTYPDIALELISDAAKVDIVDSGFDAGVRFGQELAQDMIAVPLGSSLRYIVIGSPDPMCSTPSSSPQVRPTGLRPPACAPRGCRWSKRFTRWTSSRTRREAFEAQQNASQNIYTSKYMVPRIGAWSFIRSLPTSS
jgi:DNA-binding transcriptional LysR family regulator